MKIPEIMMRDYDYDLPHSKIAQQALEPRDSAKLLVCKDEQVTDSEFKNISSFLPAGSSLFYNDARVIPARILINKPTGAAIEIFLVKPFQSDYFTTLNTTSICRWECLVGNKKKWHDDETLSATINLADLSVQIQLNWHDRENNIVRLSWEPSCKFTDLLEQLGNMPLPPYIKRDAEVNDKSRYQTIYSATQGSVAAPTAGLHFTDKVLDDIKYNDHDMTALTLHVSAGTFLPVSADKAIEHNMHQEIFSVHRSMIEKLKQSVYPIAVGTTSVRVIESLYWCATNLQLKKDNPFEIEKLAPYTTEKNHLNSLSALDILLNYMDEQQTENITGATSIMILPGYEFRFIKGLITNFHQPKSTLILLIAAFIGETWREVYRHALEHNYRFLSYGDSSLLLK